MISLCTDYGYLSLIKKGEELCGDHVEVVENDGDTLVMVLADGLGSGVKANILSILTSKILSTMLSSGVDIATCLNTVVKTLPVCEVRKIAYSTFTVVRITNNRDAELIQYDNPKLILLRNGKNLDYPTTELTIDGKKILTSNIHLELDDVLVSMSDGAIYAGVGELMNFGWQRDNIIEYLEKRYNRDYSAKTISSILIDKCNSLYAGQPGDDTTICTIKIRERKQVNLLVGPAVDPKDDIKMMTLFFSKKGKHIVCGGTTSKIASKYLHKQIDLTLDDFIDPEIPPIAKIEGVDLVTEGVITLSRVLEYSEDYLAKNERYIEWSYKSDGASQITRLLFEEATDIDFYVGRAMNPAHQNPDLPISFSIKMRLIENLSANLKKMGKKIKVSYF